MAGKNQSKAGVLEKNDGAGVETKAEGKKAQVHHKASIKALSSLEEWFVGLSVRLPPLIAALLRSNITYNWST